MAGAIQTLVDALSVGGLYALTALGIGLIFGVMRLINFAHGSLIMICWLRAPRAVRPTHHCHAGREDSWLRSFSRWRSSGPRSGRSAAADPATLLISSFAVSFFLEKTLILFVGSRPKGIDFLPQLGQQIDPSAAFACRACSS